MAAEKTTMWWGLLAGGAGLLVSAVSLLGCSKLSGEPVAYDGLDDVVGSHPLPIGQGVGQDCSVASCRPGLTCENEVCVPGGTLPPGARCVIGPECQQGLACVAGTCAPRSGGALGAPCQTDLQCDAALRCGLTGLSLSCVPAGAGDLGAVCASQSECFQGLYCASGQCSPPEPPLGVPLWKGVACPATNDDDVTALLSVPGAPDSAPDADFFQLPYPNDLRLDDSGRPDLSDFPTPGPELLGVDMVARYARAIEKNTRGWSTTPSIHFRFSGEVDFDSLKSAGNEARRVVIVDADDPSSTPERFGFTWSGHNGRTKYVCPHSIAIGLGVGGTLTPGHTHLAWLTTALRSKTGQPVGRAPHFEALLSATPPQNAALKRAHELYAPLRAYLALHDIDPETILVATVFTTDDALGPMRALANQVLATPLPMAKSWVKCATGVQSPCAQALGSRACGAGTNDYDEYHARIGLPIFQKGKAPYLDQGGDIATIRQRDEDVCLSLTVPRGAAPAGGFPLVVYGHGTGGSFRSHVQGSVAGELARATPPLAVLGIDQVQHGPRRGDSLEDPQNLFFNFTNPNAARGNPLQGAADQLSLLRFAQTLQLSAAVTGGPAIDFDSAKVLFYGHSQGSTHGSIALPFSGYPGAVFSGNGAGLGVSLLTKTNPVDIAAALPLALQDPDSTGALAMGAQNPALGLLQHYMDAADPLTFARLATFAAEEAQAPKHVFQTFGLGDTYSPALTMAGYIYAAVGMALAPGPPGLVPQGDDVLALPPDRVSPGPVSGNVGDEPAYTSVTRQYAPPPGKDGHYVSLDVAAARADIVAFLSALGAPTSTIPSVPAP